MIGATDDTGFRAGEDEVRLHDSHATIPKLMELDHPSLSVNHNGLEMLVTDFFTSTTTYMTA